MAALEIPACKIGLKRLDDGTWSMPYTDATDNSINEVRVEVPACSQPGRAYELATLVAKTVQSRDLFSILQKKCSLHLQIDNHSDLGGRWEVAVQDTKGWADRLIQWIPFTKTYPSHEFLSLLVTREKPCQFNVWKKTKDYICPPHMIPVDGQQDRIPLADGLARQSFSERIRQKSFVDPFTRLAAQALQTAETQFVSEREMQGSCRIALDQNGRLQMTRISPKDDPEENRRTVKAFYDFAVEEYGKECVEYAEFAYGFHFDEMMKMGLPLLPDHVYKLNVGVSNIEMAHVENLYKKLHQLRLDLALHLSAAPLNELLEHYTQDAAPVRFSIRELRGILSGAGQEIHDGPSLKAFLDRLLGDLIPDHMAHLMPEQFNAIVKMLMPSQDDLTRALTGRQISHLAICGYKTMGRPNQPDPSRDQAELLQIFSGLQKTEDWDNFYELLAHVAVKKNLFREYRGPKDSSVWRTGVLIPAPRTETGEDRWYNVAKISDDGEGNLNYILLPAVKMYRKDNEPLPMIHLYRSTNSNQNAIDSFGSIENDLNPEGAPGSLGEEETRHLKGGYFFNRTIPLWVGYLLHAQNQIMQHAEPYFRTALDELENDLIDNESAEKGILKEIARLKKSDRLPDIRAFLQSYAEKTHELPKFKRQQDIVFVGHSLGGALAQYGQNYFGPSSRRIPCPGCSFLCRSYNGPATNSSIDKEFMSFGREHREIIKGLGQHWKIFHQFEYGDFVPEAGESHLGGDYRPDDREWLSVHTQIFRPLDTARALPITTCPTHGRRISEAKEHIDYRLDALQPKDLMQFDHAWVLSGNLKDLFGYRILLSPTATEIIRRSIGSVLVPVMHLVSSVYQTIHPDDVQRKNGLFSCEYHAAPLQPAVWLKLGSPVSLVKNEQKVN